MVIRQRTCLLMLAHLKRSLSLQQHRSRWVSKAKNKIAAMRYINLVDSNEDMIEEEKPKKESATSTKAKKNIFEVEDLSIEDEFDEYMS